MKHYMSVTANCPVMMIIRVPWPMPRWRTVLTAMTPVMRQHGCRKKDIWALDGIVLDPSEGRTQEDLVFVERLEAGFSGDYDKVPTFWLYDWRGGSFQLARQGRP